MTMPDTPVATSLDKALNIKVNLFSELTLNLIFAVDKLTEAINLDFA